MLRIAKDPFSRSRQVPAVLGSNVTCLVSKQPFPLTLSFFAIALEKLKTELKNADRVSARWLVVPFKDIFSASSRALANTVVNGKAIKMINKYF